MANGLWNAVRECRFQQVRFLVDSGLTVNKQNPDGQHTLVCALQIKDADKRLKMFRYLLNHGANYRAFDKKTGRDILLWAVYLNRRAEAELVMFELAGDLDFHKKDKLGRTIIHYATMRGNTELLNSIISQMRKFYISVDVRDNEGFTPYMLAKRLAFEECAEILLNEGEASPHQFDQNRKTIFQWADDGEKEVIDQITSDNNKKISTYKSLGRLPALKDANFEVSQVHIVESYKDKFLLEKTIQRENTIEHAQVQDFSRAAARKRKMLSKSLTNLADDQLYDENSVSGRLRRISLNSAQSTKSLDDAIRWINLKHDPQELNKRLSQKKSVNASLPALMTILEHQSCKSYRPYVKENTETLEKAMAISRSKPIGSTMAIIFGKDGKKTVHKKENEHNLKDKQLATIKEIASGRNSIVTHKHKK